LTRQVALLRGINVGGRNLLPMKDLAALFTGAGCRDVATFIQSGNVLFDAEPDLARTLEARIPAELRARHGLETPVLLRTREELEQAVRDNPFLGADPEGGSLHVLFLAGVPDPARVAGLDPDRSPGDTFAVRGREVFLSLPGGVGRSRLTNAWFDARLATPSTGRNWRTVLRLRDLLAE
jgi:uncharacterized protein (DUF1697 family)